MKRLLFISIISLFLASGCTWRSAQSDQKNAAQSHPLTFAVIGDNEGDNAIFDSLIQGIVGNPDISFILHVGDLTDGGGKQKVQQMKDRMVSLGVSVPIYAVPGNHDIKNDTNATEFAETFQALPSSVDIENLHLILLDNAERKIGFTQDTLDWLSQDLEAAKGKIIAIAFHRPFGYPLAQAFGDDETRVSRESNEKFLQLLYGYDIAHIFTGHIHTYLDFPLIIQGEDGSKKSIPTTVSGGGGQPIQEALSSFMNEDYHYLVVTVEDGKISVMKKGIL